MAVSPKGDRFATLGQGGGVEVWKMADTLAEIGPSPLITITNRLDYDPSYAASGYTIAYSPDGSLLATVGISNTAKIWDANSGKECIP